MVWAPRELYLAIAVGLWLCGYFVQDGWLHQRSFRWVLPILLLNGDLLVRTLRETRWLWAVLVLLGYQVLSRAWAVEVSEDSRVVAGWWDTGVVILLSTALATIGRRVQAGAAVLGTLVVVAMVVTAVSLVVFYLMSDNQLAEDRLRNVFIYRGGNFPGLNAVLTGMLCGFGVVGAAWFARPNEWPLRRNLWLLGVAVLVFGLMASQSRGAMLATATGFGILLVTLRRAALPALLASLGAVVAYLLVVSRSETTSELIERGTTGRFAIYRWFLENLNGAQWIIGRGMSADVTIPEGEFEWFVHHPHSSYLTQLVLGGVLGVGLLFVVLAWAGWCAWRAAWRGNPVYLALLASGMVAVCFDCAQIFSIQSAPRIEFLLVVVPAALAAGRPREAD